jgi:hypothetical protein
MGQLESYLEAALEQSGVTVIDESTVPAVAGLLGGDRQPPRGALRHALRPYARHLFIARAEYLGERPLYYMGRREVAFQSRLTVAVVDLADGRVVATPFNKQVEYTHLNVERVVREKVGPWLRRVGRQLRPQ